MKYIELVKGLFTANNETRAKQADPYVAYSKEANTFMFTIAPEPDVSGPWVAFTAEEDNSSIGLAKLSTNQTLEYSTNTTIWNTFDTTTNIYLNNGDKVYVRGVLRADNTSSNFTQFKMTGKIAASGNCNALWNYEELEAELKNYCGYYMFSDCTSLTTAPALPATELKTNCYRYMFYKCTSLTTSPTLPATTLADYCYYGMFSGTNVLPDTTNIDFISAARTRGLCGLFVGTKVTDDDLRKILPTTENGQYYLPATSLTSYCYANMFNGCTSLTTAPALPATSLASYCYQYMFAGCTSLTTAPALPATNVYPDCYTSMFNGCTSLTTAPELPATTLAVRCYYQMFYSCTSLTTAPALPAKELTQYCYAYMFKNCSKLNNVTCLARYIAFNSCTDSWLSGVSSTGTFVKHPDMTKWTTGNYGIPNGWKVENAVL